MNFTTGKCLNCRILNQIHEGVKEHMAEWIKNTNIDIFVAAGLVVALLWSMYTHDNQLSQTIATGLIGYIGGSKAH